jgi:hypothetical protein
MTMDESSSGWRPEIKRQTSMGALDRNDLATCPRHRWATLSTVNDDPDEQQEKLEQPS